eukprot:1154444-Pelagomonas_calceolata.AAC.1
MEPPSGEAITGRGGWTHVHIQGRADPTAGHRIPLLQYHFLPALSCHVQQLCLFQVSGWGGRKGGDSAAERDYQALTPTQHP